MKGLQVGGLEPDGAKLRSEHNGWMLVSLVTVRWRVLLDLLRELWPAWLTLGGIAAAWLAAWFLADSLSAQVRYAGLLLQLFGLITVALGLARMRQLFGRPGVLAQVGGLFGKLLQVFRRPESITIEGKAGLMALAGGELKARLGAPGGASLEKRVEVLEKNFRSLDTDVDQLKNTLKKERDELRDSVENKRTERQRGDRDIQRRLEEVAVGGLQLESMGLVWLMLGIVLATASEVVVNILS